GQQCCLRLKLAASFRNGMKDAGVPTRSGRRLVIPCWQWRKHPMGAPPLKRTISRLDLFSLRLFLTICEEKSISRAAERECLAPSAATKRVQELEHLFNVQLLYRNARATIPTPVGE